MIKFQIKKKTNNIWQHFIVDGKTFILSDCYCKTNGDFFRVVEMGGSQRNEFHFSQIEVFNIGGLAETFTSSLALMQRLKSLNYVGFIREGDVVTADLISTDASNLVTIGSDGGLFVPFINAQTNTIINDNGFSLLGNDLTINDGWIWNINGIEYTNSFDVVIPIPFASTGKQRIDLIVANDNDSFTRVMGVEDVSNPTAPTQPLNTILISFINVSDGVISDPSIPIIGEIFVKKLELQTEENNQSGANVIIDLPIYGASVINLVNPLLTSISGVFYNFSFDLRSPTPYPGKRYTFRNLTGGDVTVIDNDLVTTLDSNFKTKDALDFILPNNEMITFEYGERMTEIGARSWSNIDLSSKADLVGGKVPAAQLPSYVDDVLEFANLAAFPAIGEAGKIYIAIDTNLQYRWSGSGYVTIGGGGAKYHTFSVAPMIGAISSVGNYLYQINSNYKGLYTSNSGQSNHLLIAPITATAVDKIPFNCFLNELEMTVVNGGSLAIYKTDAGSLNMNANPVLLFQEDFTVNANIIRTFVTNTAINKNDILHVFIKRNSGTQWSGRLFLKFKSL